MADLNEHFKMDISLGITDPKFVFQGSKYRITVLSDVLLRLEYNETGKFNDYPTLFAINRKFKKIPSFTVKEDDRFLNITNNYFILEYIKEKPFEASKLLPDTNLRISLKDTDKVWYYGHPEVRNLKGTTYSFDRDPNFVLGKGLYSTDGFVSIHDTDTPVFVSDGSVKKNPSDGIDIYLFMYRNEFHLALESYFELTGYPNLPPRYAFGIWWNKENSYNEKDIKDLIETFKRSEIPLSTILLGKWTKTPKNKELTPNYEFDEEKYKNPKELIDELHNNNITLGLKIDTTKGINVEDKLYEEASKLLNKKENVLPLNVYNTKLLNKFYEIIINPLLNLGVDYFWIDDNIKDKINAFMLTHFTFKNYDINKTKRKLIMSRNHEIASHRYPVLYSGKTQVSWKTLKYLPFFNLTSSNMGLSWWSHDIGGYMNGIEDRELYSRYVQLGVFSPIFRFASKGGRYYKREPWKWDVKTESIVREFTQLRHKLIPYLYTEAYKYSFLARPIIKPLYYVHKELYDEPNYKNEYYFGSELFVAPITDPKDPIMGRVIHKIFLPEGTWYDFKTGKKFSGNKRYVTFYRDEDYPVFAKKGSIIPLSILNKENLNDVSSPKDLEIQIFPGENNYYNLYEDDGETNLYKEGNYFITQINYEYKENNYTINIKPLEGKSGIINEKRNYKIRLRNIKNIDFVNSTLDNYIIPNNSYKDENDYIIELKEVDTRKELKINCGGKDTEINAIRIINEDINEIISDLQIETELKEVIANIIFSDLETRKKRVQIRKLKRNGLKSIFIKMFIKLLEYSSEI